MRPSVLILATLQAHSPCAQTVPELATACHLSTLSVRRALTHLEKVGQVERVLVAIGGEGREVVEMEEGWCVGFSRRRASASQA